MKDTNRKIDKNLDYTLALGEESLQTQKLAIQELKAQGETINHTLETTEKIESNTKKGKSILKSMSSWGGYVKQMVVGHKDPKKKKDQFGEEEQKIEESN